VNQRLHMRFGRIEFPARVEPGDVGCVRIRVRVFAFPYNVGHGVAGFVNIETTMSDLGAAAGHAWPRMAIMQCDWPNGVDSRSTKNERQ
jgi:hypothetical protein